MTSRLPPSSSPVSPAAGLAGSDALLRRQAAPASITIDLPTPPSVNKARMIDRSKVRAVKIWHQNADYALIAERIKWKCAEVFELDIVVSENHTRMDLD